MSDGSVCLQESRERVDEQRGVCDGGGAEEGGPRWRWMGFRHGKVSEGIKV